MAELLFSGCVDFYSSVLIQMEPLCASSSRRRATSIYKVHCSVRWLPVRNRNSRRETQATWLHYQQTLCFFIWEKMYRLDWLHVCFWFRDSNPQEFYQFKHRVIEVWGRGYVFCSCGCKSFLLLYVMWKSRLIFSAFHITKALTSVSLKWYLCYHNNATQKRT